MKVARVMLRLETVNVALYGLGFGLAALAVALPRIGTGEAITASPVPVPAVAKLDPEVEAPPVPVRNPFAAKGEEWLPSNKPPAATSARTAGADEGGVAGLVLIGGLSGVLTETGFVPVGETFSKGRLQGVRPGEAVVLTPEGEKNLSVRNSIRQRIKQLKIGGAE